MKKLVSILILCSLSFSVWAQNQVDPDQFQLKLIDTYMNRINDSQNVEKYVVAGSVFAAATVATVLSLEAGSFAVIIAIGTGPIALVAAPFLFFPSGADIVHREYNALPFDSPDQIAAKILAGDKALENLRDRSTAGKIVLGSLLGVTGVISLGLTRYNPPGTSQHDTFLAAGLISLGLGALEIIIPSYSEVQYDEYRSKSLVSR